MNAHSSRSHTIFQVVIERKPLDTGIGADTKIIRSKINLVDLAGSEKWKPHQLNRFSEKRIQEMTSINQSLSNLGNCVRALLEKRRQHIPYRNSKLTRLLQDLWVVTPRRCLSWPCHPVPTHWWDSIHCAVRRTCQESCGSCHGNETLDDASILRRYEHQIARLKAMLKNRNFNNKLLPWVELRRLKELEEPDRESFPDESAQGYWKQLHVSQRKLVPFVKSEDREWRIQCRESFSGGTAKCFAETYVAECDSIFRIITTKSLAQKKKQVRKVWFRQRRDRRNRRSGWESITSG